MAITLEEAKKNVQDDLQIGVIDEFQKSNWILEHIPFDDAVSPTGGGATPSYSYTRLKTQPTAQFREINTEYTPSEVTKERHTVEIKVFGGSYQIDRVIASMGGIVSEVELQQAQKIKAAQALFNDTFINGDSATDAKAFDGLDKALTGSSTEYNVGTTIDLSTSELVTKNYQYFLDMLDEFLGGLDGTPSFIAGNNKLIAKLRACARRASMYQVTKDNWAIQTVITNTTFVLCGSQKVICSAETPTEKNYTKYSAKTKIEAKSKNDVNRKLSAYDIAVRQMNQLAANTVGFYSTTVRQTDGAYTSYWHDKPELSESKTVYKFSMDGFFVTQDYRGTDEKTTEAGKWKAGFDANGNAVLNILSAVGINFSWAHGGELKLGGQANGNGALYVYDGSGTQIGYWTKDGFYAQKGKFSGDLAAAGGTFSGDLAAAGGTFSGKVSAGQVVGSHITGSSIFAGSFSTIDEDAEEVYDSIRINDGSITFGNTQKIRADSYDLYEKDLDGNLLLMDTLENMDFLFNSCAVVKMKGANWAIITNKADSYNTESKYTSYGSPIYNGFNFYKDVVTKNLYARGSKSRVAGTENYNERTLYCYEMPTPLFGDIGSGRLDENGICCVEIDDIFSETVRCDEEYFVFLQKEGEGDIWVDTKEESFFIARGTPGLPFTWELKATQKGYEMQRLDEFGTDLFSEEDEELEQIYEEEVQTPDGMENIYDTEIEEEEAYYG